MSNLKKILALVLALVMSFSLMSVSSAAYADADQIDAQYAEAVEVLTNLGIFKGDNGNFKPTAPITRQEVAAMMYRVISTDVADDFDGLYIEACKFDDGVANWAKGFVGYCANGGYVKGVGNNKFDPNGNISGIAVLAMALRAVGYDKNDEFTGPNWDKTVLSVATSLGILENVDESVVSLGLPASRQLVAELIFRTMIKAPKVTYTPAFGYQPVVTTINATPSTIGWDNFDLFSTQMDSVDKWGNPYHNWLVDANGNGTIDSVDMVYGVVGSFPYAPVAQYTTAVTECEVAPALGYTKAGENAVNTVLNGRTTSVSINAIDTVNTIGAQGRLTKVYDYYSRQPGVGYQEKITMVDTFLAVVNNVVPARFDAAGHRISESTLVLTVFDGNNTSITLTNGSTDYTYARGDMLLVNSFTDAADAIITGADQYLKVYDYAEAFEGTQTVVWWTADKHTVNDTVYDDAVQFHLDEAGYETVAHTWYKDQYGNLIGAVNIDTIYSYGVIDSIWWVNDANNGRGEARAEVVYLDGTKGVVTLNDISVWDTTALKTAYLTYSTGIVAGGATSDVMCITGAGTPADPYFLRVSTNAATNLLHDGENTLSLAKFEIIRENLFRFETLATGAVSAVEQANELTAATVEAKYAMISGTPSKANTLGTPVNTALINADTQFLLAIPTVGGYSYTAITDFNSIYSYDTAKVDCVELNDGDAFAEIVYIVGTPKDANTANYVMVQSHAYNGTLRTVGGISYYEVLVTLVNGEASTVKVLSTAADTNGNGQPDVLEALLASVGRVAYVSYTNGYATTAAAVINTATDRVPTGDKIFDVMLSDARMSGNVVYGTVGGVATYYNVTTATRIYGTLSANMTNKNVFIVYDENTTTKYATAIYVLPQIAETVAVVYNSNYTAPAVSTTSTVRVAKGSTTATAAANVFTAPTGKIFAGWNTAANGSGTAYAVGATLPTMNADLVLYAVWADTYTLTLNANDGSATPATSVSTVAQGATVKAPACAFTAPTGKVFAGWDSNDDGNVDYVVGANITVSANTTLKAVWEATRTLTLDSGLIFVSGTGFKVGFDADTALTTGHMVHVTVSNATGAVAATATAGVAAAAATAQEITVAYGATTITAGTYTVTVTVKNASGVVVGTVTGNMIVA